MKSLLLLTTALTTFALAETKPFTKEHKTVASNFLKIAKVQENIEQGFDKMMPMIEQRAKGLGLNEKQKKDFKQIYQDWFNEDIDKKSIIDQTIDLYCLHFTTEELNQLIKFYQTDFGKKFIHKHPFIHQQTTGYGIKEGQIKRPKLLKRLKPFLEKHAPQALQSQKKK